MKIIVSQSGKQHTYELIKALIKAGHQVTFITLFWYRPNGWFRKKIQKLLPSAFVKKLEMQLLKKFDPELETIRVLQAPFVEFLRVIISKISFIKQGEQSQFFFDRWHDKLTKRLIVKEDFDLLIGYEMSSALSFKEAKKMGKHTVLDLAQIHYLEIESLAGQYVGLAHLHANRFRKKVNLIKEKEYQLADRIIVLSQFAKNSMTKHHISPEKLFTANLGFNPSIFQPKNKEIKNFNHTPLNILFVGAIIKRKGIIELLKAVSALAKETSFQFKITFIGGLIDKQELDRFKGRINFQHITNQTHQALRNYYQKADLFVFPSLLDSWAMVVLECMACGTPVIVTENTGAADSVIKHGGGMVIDAGNVLALKNAILSYLENPEKIISDGMAAQRAAENYQWHSYHQAIKTFINSIRK